ncbi:MAG: cysteine methyltransferase [Acidobacteria bacterium]|nr:cysteine methyltransferase [Acidobacteriota bacterium]
MAEPSEPSWASRVWRAVRRVPQGRIATYGDIAEAADCSPRMVGRALRQAPKGLRLPWHRIVAAGGRIALPGEAGLEQRLRLEAEGARFRGRRVSLEGCRWSPPTSL